MDQLKNKDTTFAAAKALFEASKRPEVRNAAVAAAKNPVVRNAAHSAAQDPHTRQLITEALIKQQGGILPPAVTQTPQFAAAQPTSNQPPPVPRHGAPTSSSAVQSNSIPATLSTKPKAVPPKPQFDTSVTEFTAAPPAPTFKQPISGNFSSSGFVPTQSVNYDELMARFQGMNVGAPAINSPADARSQVSPTNEPYAVVKYPFNGSQFDELTSDAGDKLLLKKEVDDQWIYGMNTRTGKFGIIPFSYLDIKVPLAPTSEPKVMAQYAYSSGIEGDLQFQVGDMISVMEWVDDQWLRGKIGSSIGIFPANFVDSKGLTNVPKINKPISPVKFQPTFATATSDTVTAAYDYNSGNPDDLACSAGDVIEVVEKIDENWIRGRLRGVTGMIPVTFLEQSSITQPNLTTFEEKIVTAIADYNSNEEGHLSFSVGDKLIVVEEVDQHWYRGKPEGNIFRFSTPGLIPKSYVN